MKNMSIVVAILAVDTKVLHSFRTVFHEQFYVNVPENGVQNSVFV